MHRCMHDMHLCTHAAQYIRTSMHSYILSSRNYSPIHPMHPCIYAYVRTPKQAIFEKFRKAVVSAELRNAPTYTCIHVHSCIFALTYILIYEPMLSTYTLAFMHPCMYPCIQACMRPCTMQPCIHTPMHFRDYAPVKPCPLTALHLCMYLYTHACMRACTHASMY